MISKRLLTAAEIAGLRNLPVQTIRNLRARGRIPSIAVNSRVHRYDPEAVDAALAAMRPEIVPGTEIGGGR